MPSSDSATSLIGPLEEQGVRDAWPKVEGFIREALERDGWKVRPSDLMQQIASGEIGLYVVRDEGGEILGAVACEVQEYPNANVFNIAYCGGHELHRWAHLLGNLEAEAARYGCETVRITGRAGWGRVFPDYHEVQRVFERKVVV